MKKKRFYFHYNKPKSLQQNKVIMSVHYDGACHYCENIICNVPTQTKINKRQPRSVMAGWYSDCVNDGVTITIN